MGEEQGLGNLEGVKGKDWEGGRVGIRGDIGCFAAGSDESEYCKDRDRSVVVSSVVSYPYSRYNPNSIVANAASSPVLGDLCQDIDYRW